jgi:hypothetical protein
MPLPALVIPALKALAVTAGAIKAARATSRAKQKGKAKKVVRTLKSKGLKPTQKQLDQAAGGDRARAANAPKDATFIDSAPGRTDSLNRLSQGQEAYQNAALSRLNQSLPNVQLPGQTYTPQQLAQQQQQYQQQFSPFANQAHEGFQNGVASLAERFTSAGGGRLGSPAFATALGQAHRGFQSDLNSQAAEYGLNQQRNQQSNFNNLASGGLSGGVENIVHQPQAAGYQNLINGSLGALGTGLGAYYGSKK